MMVPWTPPPHAILIQWNYLTLRYKMPGRYWAESARLIRLCLFQVSFRTPEQEEKPEGLFALLELVTLLLDPTPIPPGLGPIESSAIAMTHWELVLTLARRTSSGGKTAAPSPGASLNGFVRRHVCLTTCLQREMMRRSGGSFPSPLSSQLVQVLAGLVVRVLGMESGPGTWPGG